MNRQQHVNRWGRSLGRKKEKRDQYAAPQRLNLIYRANNKRLYMNQCNILDKTTRNYLLEEYRKTKKSRHEAPKQQKESIKKVVSLPSLQHSSAFNASFSGEMAETELMADQEANANFISESLLEAFINSRSSIKPEKLCPCQMYRKFSCDSCLSWRRLVKLDVYFCFRNGMSLLLRKILWKVSKEKSQTPIIGRRVLESFRCDSRKMLMAALDELGEDIDVKMQLKEDGNKPKNEGMIAALYGESVFHSGGQIKDDRIENQDAYVDLGDDRPEKIKKKSKERIKKASANGLSKSEVFAME